MEVPKLGRLVIVMTSWARKCNKSINISIIKIHICKTLKFSSLGVIYMF